MFIRFFTASFFVLLFSMSSIAEAKLIHVCDDCTGQNSVPSLKAAKEITVTADKDIYLLHDLKKGTEGVKLDDEKKCPAAIISLNNDKIVKKPIEITEKCTNQIDVIGLRFDDVKLTRIDGAGKLTSKVNCFEGKKAGYSTSGRLMENELSNNFFDGNDLSIELEKGKMRSKNDFIRCEKQKGQGIHYLSPQSSAGDEITTGGIYFGVSFENLFAKECEQVFFTDGNMLFRGTGVLEANKKVGHIKGEDSQVLFQNYYVQKNGEDKKKNVLFFAEPAPDAYGPNLIFQQNTQITDNVGTLFGGTITSFRIEDVYINHKGANRWFFDDNFNLGAVASIKNSAIYSNEEKLPFELKYGQPLGGLFAILIEASTIDGFSEYELGSGDQPINVDIGHFVTPEAISFKVSPLNTKFHFSSITAKRMTLSLFDIPSTKSVGDVRVLFELNLLPGGSSGQLPGVKFNWSDGFLPPLIPGDDTSVRVNFKDNQWGDADDVALIRQRRHCEEKQVYGCDKVQQLSAITSVKQPSTPPNFPDAECRALADHKDDYAYACAILDAAGFVCPPLEE